jgi:hypothetical protein
MKSAKRTHASRVDATAQTTVAMGGSTHQVQVPDQGWASLHVKGA